MHNLKIFFRAALHEHKQPKKCYLPNCWTSTYKFFISKRRKMKRKEKERERKTTKGPLEKMSVSRNSWKDQWNGIFCVFILELLRIKSNYVSQMSLHPQPSKNYCDVSELQQASSFVNEIWMEFHVLPCSNFESYHSLSGNFRLRHQMTQKYVNKPHTHGRFWELLRTFIYCEQIIIQFP